MVLFRADERASLTAIFGGGVPSISAFGRYCLAAMLILAAGLAQADQRAVPVVRIVESDPGLTGRLADGDALYIRLGYTSDVPLRFRAEGYADGSNVVEGAMYNPAPAYPAGEGEALVWIAYRGGATINALKITVLDESWQPLAVIDAPAAVQWTEAAPRPASQRPDWIRRMSSAQQAAVTQMFETEQQDESASWAWVLNGLWFSVIGYLALQALTISRFAGGWRLAAFVPLIVTVPLLVYTVAALLAGSNLWPLALLLLAPLGFVYLLAVSGARFVMRAAGP
jgi:hypothetical protein